MNSGLTQAVHGVLFTAVTGWEDVSVTRTSCSGQGEGDSVRDGETCRRAGLRSAGLTDAELWVRLAGRTPAEAHSRGRSREKAARRSQSLGHGEPGTGATSVLCSYTHR